MVVISIFHDIAFIVQFSYLPILVSYIPVLFMFPTGMEVKQKETGDREQQQQQFYTLRAFIRQPNVTYH